MPPCLEKNKKISMSVIRRLPRYYRFLLELKNSGVLLAPEE